MLCLFDPVQAFPGEVVMDVGFAFGGVAGIVFLLLVAPNVVRIKTMGARLIEVTEKKVEPLLVGDARRARFTQAPFANASGGVSRFLENLSDGNVFRF